MHICVYSYHETQSSDREVVFLGSPSTFLVALPSLPSYLDAQFEVIGTFVLLKNNCHGLAQVWFRLMVASRMSWFVDACLHALTY